MIDLQVGGLYRVAHDADRVQLRGRLVTLTGYHIAPSYDARRACIAQVNPDGSLGQLWHVKPGILVAN